MSKEKNEKGLKSNRDLNDRKVTSFNQYMHTHIFK